MSFIIDKACIIRAINLAGYLAWLNMKMYTASCPFLCLVGGLRQMNPNNLGGTYDNFMAVKRNQRYASLLKDLRN